MKEYTKPGLFLLMIEIVLAVCITLVTYSVYASVSTTDLQGPYHSVTNSLWPVVFIGLVATTLVIIGALLVLAGRKEFGEHHRKFITYAVIVFIAEFLIVIIFSRQLSFTTLNWIAQGQASHATTIDYLKSTIGATLIDSLVFGTLFGLIWIFSFYHLEDQRGRLFLFLAFATMILVPIVTYLGTSAVINDWISRDILTNQNLNSSSFRTDVLTIAQWNGPTGINLFLLHLLQYLLMFIALYIPYRRIRIGDLKPAR